MIFPILFVDAKPAGQLAVLAVLEASGIEFFRADGVAGKIDDASNKLITLENAVASEWVRIGQTVVKKDRSR